MSSSPPSPGPRGSLADYLADREGLVGAARTTFLDLLAEVFGFKLRRPRWAVFTMSGWVAMVATLGCCAGLQRMPGWLFWILWVLDVCVAGFLVWTLLRSSPPRRRISREIEWRAYCLLIRPLILAEQPGLLDRNLEKGADWQIQPGLGLQPGFPDLLAGDRRSNLWLPALVGWCLGSAFPLAWHFIFESTTWTLLVPLGGTILGPLVWCLFRMKTYSQVERLIRTEYQ